MCALAMILDASEVPRSRSVTFGSVCELEAKIKTHYFECDCEEDTKISRCKEGLSPVTDFLSKLKRNSEGYNPKEAK